MIYPDLFDQENIRLLHFEDRLVLGDSSKPLRLLLEQFSLLELSEDFTSHADGDQPCQSWNDTYFCQIEQRRAALNPLHDIPKHTPRPMQSSTRFGWGDYEAVSYTWGDSPGKRYIQLNGILTEVSCNLEAALRMLQRLPETQCGMKYWIDALCINQDDVKERNYQVKRMDKIYSTARSVVVWLGNKSPDDDIALHAMNAVYLDRARNNWLVMPPEFGTKHYKALYSFLKKPYWGRLWIIQELVANHNSTLFVCGRTEFTRETLKLAVKCCQKLYREKLPLLCHDTDFWEISARLFRLVSLAPDVSKDVMLRKALSLSRQAMVSKEKDKVYGILALLNESISSEINPDYSDATSIEDVFTELTVAVIKATRSVEQIVYGSTHGIEWPSWVPDLRLPFPRNHMQYLRQSQASMKSSAEFSFDVCPDSNKMHLRVKGIEVDYIDGISASPTLDDSPVHSQYRDRCYNYSSVEVLGKTLVLGHPKVLGSPVFMKLPWHPKSKDTRFTLWDDQQYVDFDKFRRLNRNFTINGQTLESCFPQHSSRLADVGFIQYHLRLAAVTLKGRKLITTKTGYLGLAPERVQKQDVLVILLGCNFPVLLRHYRYGYRVIGECYVHGLMAGEIFDAQKKENLHHKTFTLI